MKLASAEKPVRVVELLDENRVQEFCRHRKESRSMRGLRVEPKRPIMAKSSKTWASAGQNWTTSAKS